MTSKEINEKALGLLASQNWEKAQHLFFQNAQKNPSHQTYNNLGFYLITEGFLCKNGKTRNSLKFGIKYLLKAAEIETSTINTCAIIKTVDLRIQNKDEDRKYLCEYACEHLKKALKLEYTDVLQYNLLRFKYLLDPRDSTLVSLTDNLVKSFPCYETVSFYLELLQTNHLIDLGLECIAKYNEFLSDIDLLMFYTKFGFYERGYNLCKQVCNTYSIDKFIASSVIECYSKTNHLMEKILYENQIKETIKDMNYYERKEWSNSSFEKIINYSFYRKNIINSYNLFPPSIDTCCYFGCSHHENHW